jgi:hypothetical protein
MRKKVVTEAPTRKPFTDENGNVVFNVRALGGKVFILPDPKWTADKLGNLIIPETVKARLTDIEILDHELPYRDTLP